MTALMVLGAIAAAGLCVIAIMAAFVWWVGDQAEAINPPSGDPLREAFAIASAAVGTVAGERRQLRDMVERLVDSYDASMHAMRLEGMLDVLPDDTMEEARALLARVQP